MVNDVGQQLELILLAVTEMQWKFEHYLILFYSFY